MCVRLTIGRRCLVSDTRAARKPAQRDSLGRKLPRAKAVSLRSALRALEKSNGCFGVCDAGATTLVNHTRECQHARIALGQRIPSGNRWIGDRLISESLGW